MTLAVSHNERGPDLRPVLAETQLAGDQSLLQ
jgi:hypothetical protein